MKDVEKFFNIKRNLQYWQFSYKKAPRTYFYIKIQSQVRRGKNIFHRPVERTCACVCMEQRYPDDSIEFLRFTCAPMPYLLEEDISLLRVGFSRFNYPGVMPPWDIMRARQLEIGCKQWHIFAPWSLVKEQGLCLTKLKTSSAKSIQSELYFWLLNSLLDWNDNYDAPSRLLVLRDIG